jgi:hypothetical protein
VHDSEVKERVSAMAEAGDLIPMCAWCGRIELNGEWLRPARGALAVIDVRNAVSHSICPTCVAEQQL